MPLKLPHSPLAELALVLFAIAYLLVIFEEFTQLKKSKSVTLCAGLIWLSVAYVAKHHQLTAVASRAFQHNLLEYAELLLFLLVAIIYIHIMEDLGVFRCLQQRIVRLGLNYRQLFWCLGTLSFFLSAIADNLTTALIMCAIALAIDKDNKQFISLSCINIVVAANAGGAFSPFGDITTLMVWQKGILSFTQFFKLFIPAIINYIIPAVCMTFALSKHRPPPIDSQEQLSLPAKATILFFLLTIVLAVCAEMLLGMPPVLGMMTGLAFLQLQSFYLTKKEKSSAYDVYAPIAKTEWDTLLFFYGIVLSVGGLAAFGFLDSLSHFLYNTLAFSTSPGMQALPANTLIGLLSALVDNIPIMYAVLTMHPQMPEGQWLLVTLTTGTGGSLLAVGSAAGVALLGQAKGYYTFSSHLRWSWAILLGYFASIMSLLLLYPTLFT